MARLDIERQRELEPIRIKETREALEKIGVEITYQDNAKFMFFHKGENVVFFPYSGWHSGKSIKDSRGFAKLLKQINHFNALINQ